ncbi:MAG: transposase [Burkholderiales bacterium]|nr:MAG: transposase [Burkholderiales bacterium]
MLALSSATRYFLYRQPTDIRKSFDGLAGLVRNELGQNPLTGDVFIFLSKRRTRIKLLQWDGDGFAIYFKRLERGAYELPAAATDASGALSLTATQLQLILSGVILKNIKYRARYQHGAAASVGNAVGN